MKLLVGRDLRSTKSFEFSFLSWLSTQKVSI